MAHAGAAALWGPNKKRPGHTARPPFHARPATKRDCTYGVGDQGNAGARKPVRTPAEYPLQGGGRAPGVRPRTTARRRRRSGRPAPGTVVTASRSLPSISRRVTRPPQERSTMTPDRSRACRASGRRSPSTTGQPSPGHCDPHDAAQRSCGSSTNPLAQQPPRRGNHPRNQDRCSTITEAAGKDPQMIISARKGQRRGASHGSLERRLLSCCCSAVWLELAGRCIFRRLVSMLRDGVHMGPNH